MPSLIKILSPFCLDPPWLSTVLPTIGKFFITSCYGIVNVFTLELLPTVVRSSGLGLANFFEQVGSIIAPFVRELVSYRTTNLFVLINASLKCFLILSNPGFLNFENMFKKPPTSSVRSTKLVYTGWLF